MKGGAAAVFLDRDGVLVADVGYRRNTEGLALLPGVAEGLRRLAEAGFLLVVVTNQSAIARGLCTHEDQTRIHSRIAELLRAEGVEIEAWLLCPHHPTEGVPPFGQRPCRCRKPEPGLLHEAQSILNVSLERSFLVGDRRSDVACAHRAGVKAVLLQGMPDRSKQEWSAEERPDHTARDLPEAAAWILSVRKGRREQEREAVTA